MNLGAFVLFLVLSESGSICSRDLFVCTVLNILGVGGFGGGMS